MEDLKFILYILAAVAYFVFMQWRKAFNSPNKDADAQPRQPAKRPVPQAPPRPATSFEEMLRELQPRMDKAEARGREVVETAKEEVKSKAAPFAPTLGKALEVKNYEDTAPKILSWEKPAEARQAKRQWEERRKQQRFETYEKEEATKNRYAKLLRDPASARDAVILSEIFKRKFE